MHHKTVHRIFDGQPGVVEWGDDGHRSRRIPESVMLRVRRDLRRKIVSGRVIKFVRFCTLECPSSALGAIIVAQNQ